MSSLGQTDDFSLYDDEEPRFPLMEKRKAYPSGSKEAVSLFFLMDDLVGGRVVDARTMTGFPTLLRDGLVTPDGLPSEELLEEIELYDEYHTRGGRDSRQEGQEGRGYLGEQRSMCVCMRR